MRYVTGDDVAMATMLGQFDVDRLGACRPVRVVRSRPGQRHDCGLFWSATTVGPMG